MLRRLVVLAVCALTPVVAAEPGTFLAGADVSHLPLMERSGHRYLHDGQAQDPLTILKNQGITCLRLRLWTSTPDEAARDPYHRGNHLGEVLPLAQRVVAAGFDLLLDFHYSDTWADPKNQHKPAAWKGLSGKALEDRLRDYNRETIASFKAAGAMPTYVQIGNETSPGMLWPEGRLDRPENWPVYAGLVKAAAEGIAAGAGDQRPKTIIHLDRGGDWATTQRFFDQLIQVHQAPFDIIGQSYYPWWQGSFADLEHCLRNTVERYGKPVLVAETAFPWTDTPVDRSSANALNGLPVGPAGQVQHVQAIGQILHRLPPGMGLGICWWGAEFQTTPGINFDHFDKRSFWGADGNVLPVVGALGALNRPTRP